MSSYFTLELDTTPPKLNIYAPNYTQNEILTNLHITSTETIGKVEELYIIDSMGHKLDLNPSINNNNLNITVNLNISVGIATLYCRLRDEVFNLSELYIKPFEIIEITDLRIILDFQIRKVDLLNKIRKIDLSLIENSPNIKVVESMVNIDLVENTPNIKIVESKVNLDMVESKVVLK